MLNLKVRPSAFDDYNWGVTMYVTEHETTIWKEEREKIKVHAISSYQSTRKENVNVSVCVCVCKCASVSACVCVCACV